MSVMLRFANKQITNQLLRNQKVVTSNFRLVTLKPEKAQTTNFEGHDEYNLRLGRPQSPHLSIYQPQLTWLLSISHRFSGIAVAGYAVALGLGAVVLPESIPTYIDKLQSMEINGGSLCTIKFLLAFPFTYHFFNGIRHLLWDTGKFLTIKKVYITGYIMLFLAISSAVALCLM